MRIVIIRNDKLGDFMLAWPTFALIKQQWPEAHITALVPQYTASMAELCPWIDALLIDEGEGALVLAGKLRQEKFDAMLTLFSTGRIALAGCLARIPYRLAPATKLAQLCYNHRLKQRRSRSEKPEYAYNLDLALQLLTDLDADRAFAPDYAENDYLPGQLTRPLLQIDNDTTTLREIFIQQHAIDPAAQLIFIHPGTGGSANNLSPLQYAQLALQLHAVATLAFCISAGPGEEKCANEVATHIRNGGGTAVLYSSAEGLEAFSRTLQLADIFISGSTGPLHIAAALDRPTAAFYPRHRSATPLRWQTLNAPDKRLAFTPPQEGPAEDVSAININEAARRISETFLSS